MRVNFYPTISAQKTKQINLLNLTASCEKRKCSEVRGKTEVKRKNKAKQDKNILPPHKKKGKKLILMKMIMKAMIAMIIITIIEIENDSKSRYVELEEN